MGWEYGFVLVNLRYYSREQWWKKGREICWEASGPGDLLLAMRWRALVISFWEGEVILGFLLGWTFKQGDTPQKSFGIFG